jgi:hypothetical protein
MKGMYLIDKTKALGSPEMAAKSVTRDIPIKHKKPTRENGH